MKILTSQQLRDADAHTLKTQNITSWELMERAALKLFEWMLVNIPKNETITILAGTGNNGGDGLALARMLSADRWQVTTYLLHFSNHLSPDCQRNKQLLENQGGKLIEIQPEQAGDITLGSVVIDAVFGTGLSRPVPEWLQQLFTKINTSESVVISVDMPSGLPTDFLPSPEDIWVHPHWVLTFQTPKLPFFLPSTGRHIVEWEVIDIDLDKNFIAALPSSYYLLNKDILSFLPEREKFSHKGNYGHALLVGGSYGKMGAVVLSATAALRAGVGLLTTAIPQCGYTVLQTAVPEAMVLTCDDEKHYQPTDIPFVPSAIGVGIGWGTHPDTADALFQLFEQFPNTPFIIDADAINILSQHPERLSLLPKGAILTPHPKELERLVGKWNDDLEKLAKAKAFAAKYEIVLVIKGAYTMITDGEIYCINTTGNAGMATAGSGDVLTGILTGLRAQGYNSKITALLGVYLHGQRADEIAEKEGMQRLIARDIC